MKIEQPTVTPVELGLLRDVCRDKDVLELGAGFGYSTVEIAAVCRRVVSVDWHRGDDQAGAGYTALDYLGRLETSPDYERITPIMGRFQSVLPLLRPASFDVIFHDGHHSYESVTADLRLALHLLSWGGAVAVHDWGLFEVEPACRPMLGAPDRIAGRLAVWNARPGRWRI